MVECPMCHTKIERKDLIKEWSATPNAKPTEIHVTIHYWQCPGCGHKFRTATRTWPQKGLKQKLKDALT
jgi:hypothetical protein